MKKIYFTLIILFIPAILLFSLYFIKIPSPSVKVSEPYNLEIK